MKVDPSARPQPSLSNLIEGTPGFLSRVLAVVALQGVFTSWVHDTAFPCILWGSSNNKDERRQHRLGESRDPSRRPYISTRHRPLITVVTVRESPTNGHTTQFVSPLSYFRHTSCRPRSIRTSTCTRSGCRFLAPRWEVALPWCKIGDREARGPAQGWTNVQHMSRRHCHLRSYHQDMTLLIAIRPLHICRNIASSAKKKCIHSM